MNKQNSGKGFEPSAIPERTGADANSPVVTPYPRADKVPENPMEGTGAAPSPKGETHVSKAPLDTHAGSLPALLNREDSEHFRTRWNEIQGKFVDDPRSAVQQADALVTEVTLQITQMFDHEHAALERQWKQGNDVSSEDLRQALLHYRSFFNGLVV